MMKYIFYIATAGILLLHCNIRSAHAQLSSVRDSRTGIGIHFNMGKIDQDPGAVMSLEGEYNLWGHLSLGGGYTYVDGHMVQDQCVDLFAKGYLLNRSLDIYVQAGAAVAVGKNTGQDIYPLFRGGMEWQSGKGVFIGLEGATLLQTDHPGFLFGIVLGFRFQ